MKKTLTLFVLAVVIFGGIWLGMRNYRLSQTPYGDAGSGNLASTTSAKLEPESASPDVAASKDNSLRIEAMKIIDRPVVASAQLSDAAKALALKKIKESSDLIRSNFDYVNPWYDLASYRKMIGDYDGAIQAWVFIGRIRPNDSVSLSNLGDLYAFTLGNYPKAEDYFLASIVKNPQNVDAYIQTAVIYEYHDTAKSSLIVPLLLSGINSNPKNINLTIALARYYQKTGDLKSARIYFEKSLELNPGDKALQEELNALGN